MPEEEKTTPETKRIPPVVEPLYSYQEAEKWLQDNSGKQFLSKTGKPVLLLEGDWRHVIDDHDDDVAQERWIVAAGIKEIVENPVFVRDALYKGQPATYFVGSVLVAGETRTTVLLVSTGDPGDGILRLKTWFVLRSLEHARKYLDRVSEKP